MLKRTVVWAFTILATLAGATLDPSLAAEPKVELLWPKGAPGAVGKEDADRPELRIYLPSAKPSGTAVVVCPGGGYGALAMDHEGRQIAILRAQPIAHPRPNRRPRECHRARVHTERRLRVVVVIAAHRADQTDVIHALADVRK